MMRTISAALLVVVLGAVGACGSDDEPKADATTPTPSVTTTTTATPTPAPTAATVTVTAKPKPTVIAKTLKPKPVLSACGKIWQSGATLPANYTGCPTISGETAVAPAPCNTGGTWATFENAGGRYVAVLGSKIYKRDPNVDGNYESTYEGCTGEG